MKKLLLLLICFVFLINTKVYADDVKCDMGEFYWKYKDSSYEGTVIYENGYDLLSIYITGFSHYLLLSESNFSFYFRELVHGHGDLSKENMNLSNSVFYTNNIGGATLPWYCYQGGFSGVIKNNLSSYICDKEYETYADMIKDMSNYESFVDYKNAVYKEIGKGQDDSKLPMLHYKLSSKNVISFPNIIDKKLSIDWDFSSVEPYASDPMAYAIEIIISANFYPNSEGQRICWDASNSAINQSCKRVLESSGSLLQKPFTFIYLREGDALYSSSNHIFATDELQDGYYLYLRTYSKDGTKSSNYKVYKCTTGGTSGQMDLTYDTDGKEYPLDDADRDEDSNYSNEYDEDSSSSADKTPTGDSYDGNGGFTFDTLYGNLTSMVSMLQGVPELWMHVMSWLPSWFPTFIVTMMGLLIVIGVLKYIF